MGFRSAGDRPSARAGDGQARVRSRFRDKERRWLAFHSRSVHRARVFRFVAVGGLGMAVNTATLYVFFSLLSLPLLVASILAVEMSIVHNYLLNNRWTFGGRQLSPQRFAKFNISALAGLAMNSMTMWLLALLGVYYLVANVFGAVIAFFVNYALSARWVWREGL